MGCKWLFVEGSGSGRGRLLEPISDCHFFLSLEGACLLHLVWQPTGLVVRLAPCHLSHYTNTPWLEGGWVSKSCLFGREDSIEIAKTWWFCLKACIAIVALLTRQMEVVSLMHYPFGYNDLNRKFLKDLTNYTGWRAVDIDGHSTFASKSEYFYYSEQNNCSLSVGCSKLIKTAH